MQRYSLCYKTPNYSEVLLVERSEVGILKDKNIAFYGCFFIKLEAVFFRQPLIKNY